MEKKLVAIVVLLVERTIEQMLMSVNDTDVSLFPWKGVRTHSFGDKILRETNTDSECNVKLLVSRNVAPCVCRVNNASPMPVSIDIKEFEILKNVNENQLAGVKTCSNIYSIITVFNRGIQYHKGCFVSLNIPGKSIVAVTYLVHCQSPVYLTIPALEARLQPSFGKLHYRCHIQ